jgi:hypothetical protein
VLQVGVGQIRLAQPARQLLPDLAQRLQHRRPLQVVADEGVQGQSLDPLHLEDGIPVALDPDALREELEVDHEGQLDLGQVAADLDVTLLQAGDLPGEALDSPLALRRLDRVDVGEVARAGLGEAQGVGNGRAAFQVGVVKAQ